MTKPPTADLWAGQTDEGELGFTYAEVDKLLYLLVDLALGSGWPIDQTPNPSYLYVDYVRAYAK